MVDMDSDVCFYPAPGMAAIPPSESIDAIDSIIYLTKSISASSSCLRNHSIRSMVGGPSCFSFVSQLKLRGKGGPVVFVLL